MQRLIFLIGLAVLIAVCSLYRIDSKDTTLDYFSPKSSASAVRYLETVAAPHIIIAQVIVNAERSQQMSEIIEKMKQEAAILGGDAVTNIQANPGTGKWAKIKPKLFENANIRANFIADVIVFKNSGT